MCGNGTDFYNQKFNMLEMYGILKIHLLLYRVVEIKLPQNSGEV